MSKNQRIFNCPDAEVMVHANSISQCHPHETAWVNPRLETGHWSGEINEIIG
jgi:hypothetical protein